MLLKMSGALELTSPVTYCSDLSKNSYKPTIIARSATPKPAFTVITWFLSEVYCVSLVKLLPDPSTYAT